ncbi:MAG: MarR family transcriptional regulator [Gemmatimonadaceae bacterium]
MLPLRSGVVAALAVGEFRMRAGLGRHAVNSSQQTTGAMRVAIIVADIWKPCPPVSNRVLMLAPRLTRQIGAYTLISVQSNIDLTLTRGCHCLAARRSARAITRLFEDALRPHALRATQFSILAALALKGSTPLGEIAELLGVERTGLTRSAALLESNGWIGVAPAPDARLRQLRLTARGRKKLEAAFPDWTKVQDRISHQRVDIDALITHEVN